MNVKAKKIAGVQVKHVKALFAKYVKGCGFLCTCERVCTSLCCKKKIGDGEEKYDNVRLVSFVVEKEKKLKQK